MNIQIYGKSKCFDTKKAERYFKERRIKVQSIDLPRYGMSRGELTSVLQAVGAQALIDQAHPQAATLRYLARPEDVTAHLLEDPSLIKTPVVRNGKRATVGFAPEVWAQWEQEGK